MTVLSGSGTTPPLPLLRTDDGGLGSASAPALTESAAAAAARVVSAVAKLLSRSRNGREMDREETEGVLWRCGQLSYREGGGLRMKSLGTAKVCDPPPSTSGRRRAERPACSTCRGRFPCPISPVLPDPEPRGCWVSVAAGGGGFT
jgi:hypothetical protein